jgi:hypothetical protein
MSDQQALKKKIKTNMQVENKTKQTFTFLAL